ncbi:hypothetical protein DL240_15575 [Lujinxingia litoralis]|uniref:Uncharacterized protein n=1 Tax=Lujinxingia litoralis TaxID=2211119 RepID=A0A328C5Z3_9DELT|nr:hypothetical protein [Lujinxingia litoralis]RAL20736.1 hypothetical protein DL240_15575 [Lujinxingia litoralis]
MEEEVVEGNKRTLKIVLIVLGAILAMSLLCCGGAAFFGVGIFSELADTAKTYYPACEELNDNSACSSCCRERGHTGHVFGDWVNEEGKMCGCLGDAQPDGVGEAQTP